MNVLYSLQHLGYTIPPQADAGWIGEAGPGPSYLDAGSGGPENDFTNRNTTFMTWNLLHVAGCSGRRRDPGARQPALRVGRGRRGSTSPTPNIAEAAAAAHPGRWRGSPCQAGGRQRSTVQENRALTRFCGRRAEPVSSKPKVTRSGVLVPGISNTTQPPPQPSRSESNESG